MATKTLEIYKCLECGQIIEVLKGGATPLCCGKPMKLMTANTVDAAKEKHIPAVTATEKGIHVVVGSVAHPMTEEHSILWIEAISDGRVAHVNLNPGMAPEADFCAQYKPGVIVRAYCDKHGLWQTEL